MADFSNFEEALAKIRHYLEHDVERWRIADNGYRRAMADHTYAKRIEALMEILHEEDILHAKLS